MKQSGNRRRKKAGTVIRISALAFLFTIQFLLIFLGLVVFLFARYRKQKQKEIRYKDEIGKLRHSVNNHKEKNEELSGWKSMFNELQGKFEKIKKFNSKLKNAIASLIPEAERSKEYKELIAGIEQSNKELDLCIGTIERENEELEEKITSYEKKVDGLTIKIEADYISKTEYNKLSAEKTGLEIRVKKLMDELESRTREHEKLDKNYKWLENEYNALYNNINEGS